MGDGKLHTYYYAGGRLLREVIDRDDGRAILDFAYDASGNPFSLTYNGTKYYYVTNLQGDVFYLVDTNGNTAAAYTYDPFGKVLTASGSLAEINPLRYRGYYYDTDPGFYYLQSRYYDPNTCRFINADGYASTGQGFIGCNMFAYCNNNCTGRGDAQGEVSRFVGAGVQLNVDVGYATIGIEVIIYCDDRVCGNSDFVIAIYCYDGISANVTDSLLNNIVNAIVIGATAGFDLDQLVSGNYDAFAAELLATVSGAIGKNASISASVVLITGNEDFSDPADYGEDFISSGAKIGKERVTYSVSDKCTSVAIGRELFGIGGPVIGLSVSKTYYYLLKVIPIGGTEKSSTSYPSFHIGGACR